MSDANFISPFPRKPFAYVEPSSASIGPLSLAESVYFFWSLKQVIFSANVRIKITTDLDTVDDPPYEDVSMNKIFTSFSPGCIAAKSPQQRALAGEQTSFVNVGDNDISLVVDGPYNASEYGADVPLIDRMFYYHLTPSLKNCSASFDTFFVDNEEIKNIGTFEFDVLGHRARFYASIERKFFQPHYIGSAAVSASLQFLIS